MALAQKAPFELVPVDAPAGGFTDAAECAAALAEAYPGHSGLGQEQPASFRRLGIRLAGSRGNPGHAGREAWAWPSSSRAWTN